MIVIRTSRPLKRVFLKTGEEVRAFEDEFREDDFSGVESYATVDPQYEEATNRLIDERLAQARSEWEEQAEQARLDALEQGRIEGAREAEARLAEKAKVLEGLIGSLPEQREKILRESETVVSALVMKIARRFVGAAAEAASDVIKQSIKAALRLVIEKDKLVIRVNPDDLDEVRNHQDDILFIGDGIGRLDIRADKQVRRGGCIVETESGNVDARIETRLVEMEKALKQAYCNGNGEDEKVDATESPDSE